jgi:hypothetical protein
MKKITAPPMIDYTDIINILLMFEMTVYRISLSFSVAFASTSFCEFSTTPKRS